MTLSEAESLLAQKTQQIKDLQADIPKIQAALNQATAQALELQGFINGYKAAWQLSRDIPPNHPFDPPHNHPTEPEDLEPTM